MKKLLTLLALATTCSLSFAASINSMSKDEVITTLEDKTITTIPLAKLEGKLINDTFIGYFNKDGKISGKFSKKLKDHLQNDEGTWAVNDNGELCVTWKHWDEGKQNCTYSYKLNNAIIFAQGDNSFESLLLNKDIQSGNHM